MLCVIAIDFCTETTKTIRISFRGVRAYTYVVLYVILSFSWRFRVGRGQFYKTMIAVYTVLSRARNIRVLNSVQISKTGSELSVIFPKARESLTGLRRLYVCLFASRVLAPSTHAICIYMYILFEYAYTTMCLCVCVCVCVKQA
jgi:hypothetical protein